VNLGIFLELQVMVLINCVYKEITFKWVLDDGKSPWDESLLIFLRADGLTEEQCECRITFVPTQHLVPPVENCVDKM